MPERIVYADCAATKPVSKRALAAAMPYLTEEFGNPSSVYGAGLRAARALLDARRVITSLLGADVRELIFTSGGTEADALAITGAAQLGAAAGKKHIITSAAEHHAVLECCKALEKQGFEVTYLPVDGEGRVSVEVLADSIRQNTALVSIIHTNNEIGTINPVAELAALCRSRGVLFHTDAVAAMDGTKINVRELGADMLSFSGHKFGAMKGTGGLYVREGISLPPLLRGGAQESGRRAGTENVPAIVSMAEALKETREELGNKAAAVAGMRDTLIAELLKIPGSRLNGAADDRAIGNVNVSFEGIEGESLVLMLDMYGIQASSGSACTSSSPEPSHVLTALGLTPAMAKGSLRLTISASNTIDDIDYIAKTVPLAVERLRSLSPSR